MQAFREFCIGRLGLQHFHSIPIEQATCLQFVEGGRNPVSQRRVAVQGEIGVINYGEIETAVCPSVSRCLRHHSFRPPPLSSIPVIDNRCGALQQETRLIR
jgi:hypothetical protein